MTTKKLLIVLLTLGALAFVGFVARSGLSHVTVLVTLQTNDTFIITGFPIENPQAQRLALRAMTAVGITKARMMASTQRDMRSHVETRHTLTNAGFQRVGLRLASRQLPP